MALGRIRLGARFAVASAIGACALALTVSGASTPTCDPDNGGLENPPGSSALGVAGGVAGSPPPSPGGRRGPLVPPARWRRGNAPHRGGLAPRRADRGRA